MTTIDWVDAFSGGNVLRLPEDEEVTIRNARGPRCNGVVATTHGDVPANVPSMVRVENIPQRCRRIVIDLEDDLWLELPDGKHGVSIEVRSGSNSHWFAVQGGPPSGIHAVDTFVGGMSCMTVEGELVLLAIGTAASQITMEARENDGLEVGWVNARVLVLAGGRLVHIVAFPLQPAAGARAGVLKSTAGRLLVSSFLDVGEMSRGVRVSLESDDSLLALGQVLDSTCTEAVRVSGGTVRVARGEVDGLELVDVHVLEVGSDEADFAGDPLRWAATSAIEDVLGHGIAIGVTGHARTLRLRYRSVVSGDPLTGFAADTLDVHETAEVSGLDARTLGLGDMVMLREVQRVGLWVPRSTRRARQHFHAEVDAAIHQGEPALTGLAHRRKRLLRLAVETQQDGHTLSVLREAEKDARRASLSLFSRERVLLAAWRWLLGYGERIIHPLVIGALFLLLLGVGQVGWAHFWSATWWTDWGRDRLDSILNFALPGIEALGIRGVPGFWGITAKIVSLLFIASAVTAAVRVVKRGE